MIINNYFYIMICELFLLGKCFNPYCKNQHLIKIDNYYKIPDTNYIYCGNPSLIDPKYNRKVKEQNMTELEKFTNQLQFEANEKAMIYQLQIKKNIYCKEKLLQNLNNYEMNTFQKIYPNIINNTDITNNKLGLPSSYFAAINNTINWNKEKKLLLL